MPETPDEHWLRAYLAEHDLKCGACGYNLRGLTSSRCPECDAEIAVTVTNRPSITPAYQSLIIGLALGAGGGIAYLLFFLLLTLGFGPEEPWLYLIPISQTLLEGGILLALLSPDRRERFVALPGDRQKFAASAAWGLTVVFWATFIVWFILEYF